MKIKLYWQRLLAAIIIICTLSGCTNSPLAWQLLYGQFDNFLYRQFISYADFSDAQKSAIRKEIEVMAAWHRRSELPLYADSIDEFEARILDRGPTADDVNWLFDALYEIGLRLDKNSPLLALTPQMQALSDEQVEQISDAFDKDYAEEIEEWEKQSDKSPAEAGAATLKKFFRRLGLKLNKAQVQTVEQHLAQRQLSREAQQAIWREWSDQLLVILAGRTHADFAQRFSDHHFARIDLVEIQAPQRWRHDDAIYRTMLLDLFQSLDDGQKQAMRKKLQRIKAVVVELADAGPVQLDPLTDG
ncbi:MAG: DUF6279 family lipoprotein [Pseudomonadota bacterium]